jgi:hypothetical protein
LIETIPIALLTARALGSDIGCIGHSGIGAER